MIGLARNWADSGWIAPERIAASLGIFAGSPANSEQISDFWLFSQAGPRARHQTNWRADRSPAGLPVVFYGWLDDTAELAVRLGVSPRSDAALYAAAFEAWGDRADSLVTGTYAAIIPLPDKRVRLARSPLGSYPLCYANDRDSLVVCSIARPIFASGFPQVLDHDYLITSLALQMTLDKQATQWRGLRQVPDGSIVYLSRDGERLECWYDLLALTPTRLSRDSDYVEAANALLADSVRNALGMAKRPAIALSGGLDSPIGAAEILRQLPAGARIPSFTFHPLDEWNDTLPSNKFGDERQHVRAFAGMYPQIDLNFVDNRDVGFDHKAKEMFLACSSAFPGMAVATPHHGLWQAAASQGVDVLFSASGGNMTFSNTALWAYPEFLVRGRWKQLWQLAASRMADERSTLQRILALGLMPLLPQPLRSGIRRMRHGKRPDYNYRAALIKPEASLPSQLSVSNEPEVTSQRQWLAYVQSHLGIGAEITHGFEQVFGIRGRDVTQYRPLMEFCFTIPTDQYVRDGQDRWLARRMAEGKVPEAQRLERRHGRQNVDWHAKLTPRLPELRQMVTRIADQPELAAYVDCERALALIDNWPAENPPMGHLETELRFALPSTLLMSQFVDFVTGRN